MLVLTDCFPQKSRPYLVDLHALVCTSKAQRFVFTVWPPAGLKPYAPLGCLRRCRLNFDRPRLILKSGMPTCGRSNTMVRDELRRFWWPLCLSWLPIIEVPHIWFFCFHLVFLLGAPPQDHPKGVILGGCRHPRPPAAGKAGRRADGSGPSRPAAPTRVAGTGGLYWSGTRGRFSSVPAGTIGRRTAWTSECWGRSFRRRPKGS